MRLWHYSPLARGIVEINLGFQLADGVSFTAGDEFDQAIVDEFWNHPVNNFGVTFIDRVRSLMLTGEACWPVFTEPNTGLQRVADLHPSLIHDVIPDPDNSSQAIGVMKRQTTDHPERRFRVINIGGDAMFSPAALQLRDSFTDGECHFFAVNRIGGLRGTSDLMPALDWIEAYERALFGELERWALLRNFIWDVTLHGATQEQIDARAAELAANPPRPGDVRIHNESEEWKSLAPELGAYEASNISRLMRNHILAAVSSASGSAVMPRCSAIFRIMAMAKRRSPMPACMMLTAVAATCASAVENLAVSGDAICGQFAATAASRSGPSARPFAADWLARL